MPTHQPNYDVTVTPSWPLPGDPAVSWSDPTTVPDHWRVFVQTFAPALSASTPSWAGSTDVSGSLPPSSRTFDLMGAVSDHDGAANFVWVIGFNADESQAGAVYPVQLTGNKATLSGTVGNIWPTGPFSTISNMSLPWTLNAQVGGSFSGSTTFSISSLISGVVPNTNSSTGAGWHMNGPFPLFTNIVSLAGPSGDVFTLPYLESVTNLRPNGSSNVIAPGAVPPRVAGGQTSPVVGGATMNCIVPGGDSSVMAAQVSIVANYISPPANDAGGGAGAGPGGGGFTPPPPPPPPPSIFFKVLPLPVPTPLPCVPCCRTAAPCICGPFE